MGKTPCEGHGSEVNQVSKRQVTNATKAHLQHLIRSTLVHGDLHTAADMLGSAWVVRVVAATKATTTAE